MTSPFILNIICACLVSHLGVTTTERHNEILLISNKATGHVVKHEIWEESASSNRDKRAVTTDTDFLLLEDREELLDLHNQYRAMEPASDMRFMIWDAGLATMARSLAATCVFDHDDCDCGQNIYYNSGYNIGASGAGGAITAFWNEIEHYNAGLFSCDDGETCGHYTQVIWADTHTVGCSIEHCESINVDGTDYPAGFFTVCNYLSAGNVNGQDPYTSGTACADCPADAPTCEDGLCRMSPLCGSKMCANGGTLDTSTCECDCANGEITSDCSTVSGCSVDKSSVFLVITLVAGVMAIW